MHRDVYVEIDTNCLGWREEGDSGLDVVGVVVHWDEMAMSAAIATPGGRHTALHASVSGIKLGVAGGGRGQRGRYTQRT